MSAKGYLDGTRMATAFNMLRSGDLVWPYVVNNYMRGRDPVPFDLLYWNADATRMSAANHSFYLRNCYLDNNLVRGMMKLAGENLLLSDIKIPIYNLAAKEDHIAPALSVFTGCQYFGGDVTYVLSGSGHIAGVVNPPAKNKYQYWTGGSPVGSLGEWLEKSSEHPGSWWNHWQAWIEALDGNRAPARLVGANKMKTLGDAPGTYVKMRV
jgi:polyhydroxyalkanoate synthase